MELKSLQLKYYHRKGAGPIAGQKHKKYYSIRCFVFEQKVLPEMYN